jgi:hypothetical protein
LVVQFDTNGDGVVDASTTADGEGNFSWSPSGLAAGPVTVEARAVDYDSGGSAVVGDWTSVSFTQAGSSATRVASLAVADNVGPSASAAISTDGLVVGQLTGGGGGGVPVQIDTNGDGVPDAIVSADGAGHFSFTLPCPTEGVVSVAARPAPSAADAAADAARAGGGWTTVSFVYTANPDSASAQSEAQSLASALAQGGSAAGGGQSSSEAYQSGQAGAAGNYDTTLAQAQALAQKTSAAAQANYNATAAAANNTYNQSMAAAAAGFTQNLGSFQGDTTSYSDQGLFVWPDAPPAPPGPDDSASRPTAPVAAPTFSGPMFDASFDGQYNQGVEANWAAYYATLGQVGDDYATQASLALGQKRFDEAAARNQFGIDMAAAGDAYAAALATPNPTDMRCRGRAAAGRRRLDRARPRVAARSSSARACWYFCQALASSTAMSCSRNARSCLPSDRQGVLIVLGGQGQPILLVLKRQRLVGLRLFFRVGRVGLAVGERELRAGQGVFERGLRLRLRGGLSAPRRRLSYRPPTCRPRRWRWLRSRIARRRSVPIPCSSRSASSTPKQCSLGRYTRLNNRPVWSKY